MKYLVHIERDAERDLQEILDYLDQQQPGLASIFLDEYSVLLIHLASFASSVQKTHNEFRHVVVGRFKILLIFKFDGKCVLILRLIHGARNPELRYKPD